METEKVRDDVWKFKGIGSVYLIRGNKNILIDAGDSEDRDGLIEELSKIISPDRIDVVLLTHLHYDHIGCIDLFSNAEIFASNVEIANYMEDARGFHFYATEKGDEILRQKLRPLPMGDSGVGSGGSVVGGRMMGTIEGLEVLKVPGHTGGSVAFLDRTRKILFSGDTIFGDDIIGRTDFPGSVPEDMEGSVEMLRTIVKEDELVLCPGHGY